MNEQIAKQMLSNGDQPDHKCIKTCSLFLATKKCDIDSYWNDISLQLKMFITQFWCVTKRNDHHICFGIF